MTFANVEAEQQLLGAILTDNSALALVGDMVRPEFFADPVHQRIFEASVSRINSGLLASPVTLKMDMEADTGLRDLGGPAYLARLAGSAVAIRACRDYAKIIIEAAARRALSDSFRDGQAMLESGSSAAEVKTALTVALKGLETGSEKSNYSLLAAASSMLNELLQHYQGKAEYLRTGVAALDKVIRGLAPGNVCLIGGATSMGKTSLALEIAMNVARQGKGVVFVSLEMSKEELAGRIASSMSRVAYAEMRDAAAMEEDDFRKIIEAAKTVESWPLHIVPKHVRDIDAIRAASAKAALGFPGGKPELVIVDYAQLVKGPGKDRYEKMTNVSIELKDMAERLAVPVMPLVQLSRDIGRREDKRPQLVDIKETGQFENDADQAVFCHREAYWLERQGPDVNKSGDITPEARNEWLADLKAVENRLELIVRKNRHGRLATAEVGFHLPTNRFWDLSGEQEEFR